MKKYRLYVSSIDRYFATEKDALDFLKKLLVLNIGGDISVKEIGESK